MSDGARGSASDEPYPAPLSLDPDDPPSAPPTLEHGLDALRASEEFTGPVEGLDGRESNDHLALIYESQAEQLAVAIPFVRQGLERGERCFYIADDNSKATVLDAMREAGIEVDAALERGDLSVHTKQDTYLRDGEFVPRNMIQFLDEAVTEATEFDGYSGLRVAGEMTWILGEDIDSARLVEYEGKLNDFIPEKRCIALCQYNRHRFDPELIRDIVRTHPHLVYDNTVCQNFYYVPPTEFFGPERPAREVDRQLQTLLGRTRAKEALWEKERGLAALNEMSRTMMDASDDEIGERAVDAARTIFDASLSAVWRYDDATGDLRPQTAAGERADDAFDDGALADLAWTSFVTGDSLSPAEFRDEVADAEDVPFESAVVLPLGRHGVFATAWLDREAVDDATVDFARAVAATTRTALDRAERERTLQRHEQELQRQNEQLKRLDRINSVIRDIDQVLVRATGRDAIEREVCERLTRFEPYQFAWVGESDARDGAMQLRQWAGDGSDYLKSGRNGATEGGARPAAVAVRTGEPQVVQNTLRDPEFEPGREDALAHGFHSLISIPVTYGESTYGALTVYADRPNVFDETEREVLAELGETIGHAINAVERKRALVTDAAVRLEFQVGGPDVLPVRLARRSGCEIEFEGTVPQSDGASLLFFTTTGASEESVLDAAASLTSIESVRCLEAGDECFFEARITGPSVAPMLVEHGAIPRTISANAEEATVVFDLPKRSNVRSFVETFQQRYPGADLVGRHEHDRPLQTTQDFRAELKERLTDRQLEVLRTAYLSGFFESPRLTTAEEVADSFGVSQPTISNHVRAGERKLFDLVFGDQHW